MNIPFIVSASQYKSKMLLKLVTNKIIQVHLKMKGLQFYEWCTFLFSSAIYVSLCNHCWNPWCGCCCWLIVAQYATSLSFYNFFRICLIMCQPSAHNWFTDSAISHSKHPRFAALDANAVLAISSEFPYNNIAVSIGLVKLSSVYKVCFKSLIWACALSFSYFWKLITKQR